MYTLSYAVESITVGLLWQSYCLTKYSLEDGVTAEKNIQLLNGFEGDTQLSLLRETDDAGVCECNACIIIS